MYKCLKTVQHLSKSTKLHFSHWLVLFLWTTPLDFVQDRSAISSFYEPMFDFTSVHDADETESEILKCRWREKWE